MMIRRTFFSRLASLGLGALVGKLIPRPARADGGTVLSKSDALTIEQLADAFQRMAEMAPGRKPYFMVDTGQIWGSVVLPDGREKPLTRFERRKIVGIDWGSGGTEDQLLIHIPVEDPPGRSFVCNECPIIRS